MKVLALMVIAAALGVAIAHPISTLDMCKLCINFADDFINYLVNIILNAGVIGSCADLCQDLGNKTHSQLAGVTCNILCDIVGVEGFVDIIKKADLDPIFYCELLKTCPIKDDGDAKINSLVVTPQPVVRGNKFSIMLNFTTVNGTGTGEINMFIATVDGVAVGEQFLSEPLDPGTYTPNWEITAAPDPTCDPDQGPCENWTPGNYSVQIGICNGECGSEHPHSKVYDKAEVPFAVVKGQ